MRNVNLCKILECKYAENERGCKLFTVAHHCPLVSQPGVDFNEYWVYVEDGISPERLSLLKKIHDQEVKSIPAYKLMRDEDG